jgi:alpha-beta hydrolase superfamily lysophospholipase
MKWNVLVASVAALLLSCCVGCQQQDYARALVARNAGFGSIENILPKSEEVLKEGRISASRVFTMSDKTPIEVWVIKARNAQNAPVPAKATILLLHMLYGSKGWPFLGAGERLAKMGYDVVLPDLRAHGHSGGQFITYGAKEKNDLKLIMDQLISEKGVSDQVYVFGINLGGCIAIQYAAIDDRCKGVMAVAPYSDLRAFARLQFIPLMLNDADLEKVVAECGKMGDFNPAEASAVEAAKKLKCPLLLFHGVFDLSVPIAQSQAILDAAHEPKKLTIMSMEQLLAGVAYEDWIAGRMDTFVREGMEAAVEVKPTTAPKPAGN